MPDPDLEMEGGGEGTQTLRLGEGGGLPKKVWACQASVWSKNKGGEGVSPLDPPLESVV